jgi:hypothetical protein
MTDVARIGRAWSAKAANDDETAKALAGGAAKPQMPNKVTADPPRMRPFPWSPTTKPGVASGTVSASIASELDSSALDVEALRRPRAGALPIEVDVDLFAALEVALELSAHRRPEALALCGIDEARFAEIDATWADRMKRDPTLHAAFTLKVGDHRIALRRLLAGARGVLATG